MFSMDPAPTFETHVAGFVPGRPLDGCRVKWRYKDADELKAWYATFSERPLAEAIEEVVDGWSDAPLDYTPGAVARVALKYPSFPGALLESYRREIFEARAKN